MQMRAEFFAISLVKSCRTLGMKKLGVVLVNRMRSNSDTLKDGSNFFEKFLVTWKLFQRAAELFHCFDGIQ